MPTAVEIERALATPKRRRGNPSIYAYKLAGALEALDAPLGNITLDKGRMTATGIFATASRDRAGDVMDIQGIQTYAHRENPVVLLNHGIGGSPQIGVTRSPEGEYTVKMDADVGEAEQITYFSQTNPVAEQTYALICENILRGNSIGFKPLQWHSLPIDRRLGLTKSNKHYQQTELVEISWTPVPENAECIAPLMDKNFRLEGKILAPCIKSLLMPFAGPKRAWSSGVTLKEKAMPQSAVDETRGAPLRDEDKKKKPPKKGDDKDDEKDDGKERGERDEGYDKESPGDTDERVDETGMEEEKSTELPSAVACRDMHTDLGFFHRQYKNTAALIEHPEIKAHIDGVLTSLLEHQQGTMDTYHKHHPDLPKIAAEEDMATPQNAQARADDLKEDETGNQESPHDKKKSLTPEDVESLLEVKDFLREIVAQKGTDKRNKAAIKHYLSCLDRVWPDGVEKKVVETEPEKVAETKALDPDDDDEDDGEGWTPEQIKELEYLSRAAERTRKTATRVGA